MNHIFAVDAGRELTKACTEGQQLMFKSYVAEWHEVQFEVMNKGDFITQWERIGLNGSHTLVGKYFVGDIARRESGVVVKNSEEGKGHEKTAVLILTALHQLGAWGSIKLATCVPLDTFKSDASKLKNILVGKHSITVNGTRREIEIKHKDMFSMPEGMASYYTLSEATVLGKMVHIINIGSEKSHVMTFDHQGTFVGAQSGAYGNQAWGKLRGKPAERAKTLAKNFRAITDGLRWGQVWLDDYDQPVEKLFYLTGGAAEVAWSAFTAYYPNMVTLPNTLYSDCEGLLQLAFAKWKG